MMTNRVGQPPNRPVTKRSKSFYLHELVTSGLDRLEWGYSFSKRFDDIRAGRRTTVSPDEAERNLGLQDEKPVIVAMNFGHRRDIYDD